MNSSELHLREKEDDEFVEILLATVTTEEKLRSGKNGYEFEDETNWGLCALSRCFF